MGMLDIMILQYIQTIIGILSDNNQSSLQLNQPLYVGCSELLIYVQHVGSAMGVPFATIWFQRE